MTHQLTRSLYARVLGSSFERLSPILRRIHDERTRKRYAGRCSVRRGTGLFAQVFGALARLPRSHTDVAVEVTIECTGMFETWTRRFGTHEMRSRLRAGREFLEERLGALTLTFELAAEKDRIVWSLRSARFLFLPLPSSWFSACTAAETSDGGRYRFDVRAEMRGIGLIVHYEGWMIEHAG